MIAKVDMEVLKRYFNTEVDALDFLNELHELMAEYAILLTSMGDRYYIGEEHARRIDFLQQLYRAVREAVQ